MTEKKTLIVCPDCGEVLGYYEYYRACAIPTGGLKCSNCKKVVIEATEGMWVK